MDTDAILPLAISALAFALASGRREVARRVTDNA